MSLKYEPASEPPHISVKWTDTISQPDGGAARPAHYPARRSSTGSGLRVWCFAFRVSCFAFRVSGVGFQELGVGFQVQGFKARVAGHQSSACAPTELGQRRGGRETDRDIASDRG